MGSMNPYDFYLSFTTVDGKPLTREQKKKFKEKWDEYSKLPSKFVIGKKRR